MPSALLFAFRHLLVVTLVTGGLCLLWTILFVVLIIIAMLLGDGAGSPLIWPLGIVAILVICVPAWLVFMTACGIGLLAQRRFRLEELWAFPITLVSSTILCVAVLTAVKILPDGSSGPASIYWPEIAMIFLMQAVLFPYWWLTEGPGVIWNLLRRWWNLRHSTTKKAEEITPPP